MLVFFYFPYFLPSLVPGELPTPNTPTPAVSTPAPTVRPHNCPDGEFACGAHGECVTKSKVCDFRQDCSDGSVELNCGKIFIFSFSSRYTFSPQSFPVLQLPSCFLFPSLPFSFSSEGTLWFWRRHHLWLEERRLLFGPNPRFSLVTWPRGEHSWWRAVPPSYSWPHLVSASKTIYVAVIPQRISQLIN